MVDLYARANFATRNRTQAAAVLNCAGLGELLRLELSTRLSNFSKESERGNFSIDRRVFLIWTDAC